MRILMIHNYYQYDGGEDMVFNAEKKLLQDNGHEVIEYLRHNQEVKTNGLLSTGLQSLWSTKTYSDLIKLIKNTNPDIAHFHNIFFMVSPSAYYACSHSHVPVVQTLHNFRLLCPAATFLRNDKICEDCLGKKFQYPGIVHGCWQHSRIKSTVVAIINGLHLFLGTWKTKVDRYIVLTNFCKQKFEEGGLPPDKIVVKPNFLSNSRNLEKIQGEYALFVGRISPEKGLDVLLDAWKNLPGIPLKIVGNGPIMSEIKFKQETSKLNQVELVGQLSNDKTHELISHARFLVVSSICYENFPMAIIEAFSFGIPVLVPDSNNFLCLVCNGETGLHFQNGDSSDLAEKARWGWEHPDEMLQMGKNAFEEFQQKYTVEKNYLQLLQIYNEVIASSRSRIQ